MNNKKVIITAIVTIVLAIVGGIFGIKYTQEDVEKISTGVETIVDIIDNAEVPNLKQEDEQTLEVQETDLENDKFAEKSEVAYNGSDKTPNVKVGAYKGLTYYSQADSRWAKHKYGNNTMINSGCGPTSAAMVVSSIKGEIRPDTMGDLFVKYGYRSANAGTYWSSMKWTADVFNIGYKETSSFNTMIDKLKDNNYVVTICREGLFTYGGHFIVIVGIDGNTLKVYDPYLYSGKFVTASRKGANVTVKGNTVYVSKTNFKKYANAVNYFCFKNDRTNVKEVTTKTTVNKNTATVKKVNYKVKIKENLNIRKGASTSYKKVGTYSKGTTVKITAESNGFGKTNKGWICLKYTSKITNKYKIVAKSGLIIRKGAGTKYKKVGTYKYKAKVTITKKTGNWGKTSKGWINLKYTKRA